MGEWSRSKENGEGLRLQRGIFWGNRTLQGVWRDGRLASKVTVLAPHVYTHLASTLWSTRKSQQAAHDTAGRALNSAIQARSAAREAMTLARAAQAISRGQNGGTGGTTANGRGAGKSTGVGPGAHSGAAGQASCSPLPRFDHGEVHPSLDYYHQVRLAAGSARYASASRRQ